MRKSKHEIPVIEQWVEVWTEDDVTYTALYPSNQVLLAEAQAMSPRPELVYRRIHFPAGVPPLYNWTLPPDEQTRVYGGGCVQRMTFQTWLVTLDVEAHVAGGHIGPTGVPLVPRPKERGGCDCEACTENEHVLYELGYQT